MTPAAPPASGPQEAATPLAALTETLLAAARRKDHASRTVIGVNRSQLEGEAIGLDAAAMLVRDLAPAWDALAGERDALNAQCEDAHAENARLIRRMKALADHWQREYASETGWPSRCAIELREALEAPDA